MVIFALCWIFNSFVIFRWTETSLLLHHVFGLPPVWNHYSGDQLLVIALLFNLFTPEPHFFYSSKKKYFEMTLEGDAVGNLKCTQSDFRRWNGKRVRHCTVVAKRCTVVTLLLLCRSIGTNCCESTSPRSVCIVALKRENVRAYTHECTYVICSFLVLLVNLLRCSSEVLPQI